VFGNLKYSVRSNNEHLSRVNYKSGKKSVTRFLRLSPFYVETGDETRRGKYRPPLAIPTILCGS